MSFDASLRPGHESTRGGMSVNVVNLCASLEYAPCRCGRTRRRVDIDLSLSPGLHPSENAVVYISVDVDLSLTRHEREREN